MSDVDEKQLNVRLKALDWFMLSALCQRERRTQSGMVRWLIMQEYQRMTGKILSEDAFVIVPNSDPSLMSGEDIATIPVSIKCGV